MDNVSGPLFDGRASRVVAAFCEDVERRLSEEAAAQIRMFLPTQYKYLGASGGNPQDNPAPVNAGFYESQIHAEASAEGHIVTDSGVIYGPWLEGVSERNRTTRFRGYGAFRKISQEIDRQSGEIAGARLPPHIRAMNGA